MDTLFAPVPPSSALGPELRVITHSEGWIGPGLRGTVPPVCNEGQNRKTRLLRRVVRSLYTFDTSRYCLRTPPRRFRTEATNRRERLRLLHGSTR